MSGTERPSERRRLVQIRTHLEHIAQLLHHLPLFLAQLEISQPILPTRGELLDRVPIPPHELEYFVHRVPSRLDISRHHSDRDPQRLQVSLPPWKEQRRAVEDHVGQLAELGDKGSGMGAQDQVRRTHLSLKFLDRLHL